MKKRMVTLLKLHQKLPQMKKLEQISKKTFVVARFSVLYGSKTSEGKYHIMLYSGCRFRNLTWIINKNLKSNTAMFSFHSVNLVFDPIQQYSMSMTNTPQKQ